MYLCTSPKRVELVEKELSFSSKRCQKIGYQFCTTDSIILHLGVDIDKETTEYQVIKVNDYCFISS